ncbi:TonB-dependent receptor plug domain-containing protein [Methylobacterium gnaphalii]|uniref:TonB-dependent receptor n=1 Tax=Methylobacterium gnaphalii TaxID=1010610 RepID=A0A512JJA7_9HYPH|nr:TonB-dependent receptor [Methylobacterium gnaphalii]GEP10036.1 TonB-dependent receptor [Methylobacterium gnaphalii]GJD67699.1 Vitamin B12 transporter BtuB [Methylobacterium gnaphalii]GLS48306.1 TonB-dependent receptor [Methylobacterium gnaphalii]
MLHLSPRALKRTLWSCVAFTLLDSLPAFAQQTITPLANAGPGTADTLEEISVSATGVPTPISQTGSSVTVLSAETLEQQQRRTVSDALQQVPGLNIVQNGGPGGQTSVFIRGANPNHTKVLIDGIDASDPSNANGAIDFAHLLTDDLARIEVLRGPQSGLYGADAIGGVVSFTTKRGEGPTKIAARVEGGSYGTFNQSSRLSGSQDGFDYSVSVAHFRAAATPVTPLDLVPPSGLRRPNYYDNETVSAKLGYQVTDEFRINSTTRFSNATLRFNTDDYSLFPAPVQFGTLRNQQGNQQLFSRNEAEWTPVAGFRNVFAVNYSNLFNRNTGDIYNPLSMLPTDSTGERLRYEYRGDYLLSPGNLILFGAQRDEERLSTFDPNPFGTGESKARKGNTAGYIEAQLTPFDRAALVANLRHDENDAFGPATTFRVAPSYVLPFSETRLKGSVGSGFKTPTLYQLYLNIPTIGQIANPNLRPEESLGYDAAFEQPLGERVLVGATYYHNDYRNLIQTEFLPGFQYRWVNVGRAESYGAEAFASVKFTDTLSGRLDYTNTVTKDEVSNLELLRRPRHKGSATALWTPMPGLTLSGTLVVIGPFVDGNRDFSVPRLKNPGFTTINLAVNYDIDETVSVFGRVDNLFDRRYENPTGYLGPGLAVYGGVRVSTF